MWQLFSSRRSSPFEMAGVGPLTQDWEPVVVRKKAPNASAKKDEKAVNAARRAGGPIETIKKCTSLKTFPFLLYRFPCPSPLHCCRLSFH